MKSLRVNGYDMSYIEAGDGVPLILVHGTLCDCRYWGAQVGPLSKACRVIAVSLRHCYPDKTISSDYSAAQHTADVAAFIAALGTGPVHLLGHSRGGYIAFSVALQFPDRIRSLILADPGGELDAGLGGDATAAGADAQALFRECGELVKQGDIDGALVRFSDVVNGPGAWEKIPAVGKIMMRDNAHTLIAQATERREPYSRAAIGDIRAPTLVINGGRSRPFLLRISDAMMANLKDARRVIIENAGHPMSAERPEAFNAAVLEFLAAH